MTQPSASLPNRKTMLTIGSGLVIIALAFLVGFGAWLASRGHVFTSGPLADAILFIDVPGRIAIDGTLQVEGPAPVPVSVGAHKLTFFDAAAESPLEVSVGQGEFRYVPNPSSSRADDFHGAVQVTAFPPDTTIEIPDCTPLDAKYPVTCRSNHTLSAKLSPGTYTLKYSNPHLGDNIENFTISADSLVRREYSYITTVAEWDEWRRQHGEIIERNYSRRLRGSGDGDALLLPFEATGELVEELFD